METGIKRYDLVKHKKEQIYGVVMYTYTYEETIYEVLFERKMKMICREEELEELKFKDIKNKDVKILTEQDKRFGKTGKLLTFAEKTQLFQIDFGGNDIGWYAIIDFDVL